MTFIILIISLLVLPFCLGLFFRDEKEGGLIVFAKGYVVAWCVFFIVAIPCIIFEKTLSVLLSVYEPIIIGLAVLGMISRIIRKYRTTNMEAVPENGAKSRLFEGNEWIYLGLFLGLWLFQMYKTIFYAFADGDDAYYVSMAVAINSGDGLYTVDPYTGIYTTLIYRYALAPFPAWIAAISRISGMHTATLAHIVLNAVLITITYVIYNETAKLLFNGNREKRYMFMTLLAVFAIFSNVSQSMADTFLLTRARQGKEVLANVIIPILVYSILKLIKADELKIGFREWCFLVAISFAGALTSLFANALIGIVIAGLFIYSFYRKSNLLTKIYIAATALPALSVVALYWRLR